MECSVARRLVGQAQARAELVGIDELKHLVEAQSEIEREHAVEPPLVRHIGADQVSGLGDGIENRRPKPNSLARKWSPGKGSLFDVYQTAILRDVVASPYSTRRFRFARQPHMVLEAPEFGGLGSMAIGNDNSPGG